MNLIDCVPARAYRQVMGNFDYSSRNLLHSITLHLLHLLHFISLHYIYYITFITFHLLHYIYYISLHCKEIDIFAENCDHNIDPRSNKKPGPVSRRADIHCFRALFVSSLFFSGLMKCNFWSSAQIEKDTFMATLACPRPITRNPQTHNNWSQAM
jgi:hypothetical protein